MIAEAAVVGLPAEGAILRPMPATANDLALRYLLELSADIRAALLMDRGGEVLAAAGALPPAGLPERARRVVAEVDSLAPPGETVEVDVFAARGALFVLAEDAHVMVCTTNRAVNPGLIFYDMHAVLRDLDRAAAAEERREAAETNT
jgi:hypothetical protein